jgi:aminoglycoside phosphotransferase (APT) family kinase protein
VTRTAQPNAQRLSRDLLRSLVGSVAEGTWPPREIVHRDQHSNDFAEVRLTNGRSLVVKRARFEWAGSRFATSRIAAGLIRAGTDVAAPAPLPLPRDLDEQPIEVYWRIDLPTLQELWPALGRAGRREALRSWGELTARIHAVRLDGFGPLSDPSTPERSLSRYLREELEDRLLPAVSWEWSNAEPIVEGLIAEIPEIEQRVGGASRLVHNDLHMGNILCQDDEELPRCTGVVDLEAAIAAPPEADIAIMQVHHGPLFAQRLNGKWFTRVREGYSEPLDPFAIDFFRTYHLINMGFYSAIVGHKGHASRVARMAAGELEKLGGVRDS